MKVYVSTLEGGFIATGGAFKPSIFYQVVWFTWREARWRFSFPSPDQSIKIKGQSGKVCLIQYKPNNEVEYLVGLWKVPNGSMKKQGSKLCLLLIHGVLKSIIETHHAI